MAATIEYAIRSRDQSQAGVKSAESGILRLRKSVEGFSKILTGTILGGSTLMAVRQIVQFGSASIQAAKDAGLLTPELDKITKQVSSLKVAIGTGLAEGLKGAFKGMSEGLDVLKGNKVATAIAGTIEKIGQAFKLLWDILWTTGSGVFVRVFVFLGKVGLEAVKALFYAFKAVFEQIGTIWDNIAFAIKSTWVTVINWIIDAMNKVLAFYNSSPLAKLTGKIGEIGRLGTDLGKAPGAVDFKKITAPFSTAFKNIEVLTVDFGQGIVDSFKTIYQDVLDLLNPPANVSMPFKPGTWTPPKLNPLGTGMGGPAPAPAAAAGGVDIGSMIMSLLSGASGTIGTVVQAIINPLSLLVPVFNAMMEVLGPVADSVLAPLVGILKIMGQTIGRILVPILTALTPVIEILAAGFVFLYNYSIVPLGNGIIFLVNMIYNLLTGIWNAIANAVNWALGWLGVHLDTIAARAFNEGFLQPINMNDLTAAGTDATGAGASGGGAGATYSGAPTYYITVNNDFEAGSVIDSSGTWSGFVRKVFIEGTLQEAARQGA